MILHQLIPIKCRRDLVCRQGGVRSKEGRYKKGELQTHTHSNNSYYGKGRVLTVSNYSGQRGTFMLKF